MWPLIALAAIKAGQAYSSASVANAQAEANSRVSAATTEAGNRVRTATNAFAAARGSLARYMQSVNNNQTLEAGGYAMEENLINARRTEDASTKASFEDQIKNAEMLGQQAAGAAFAGVGGEVADTVSISTRLMQQRASLEALRTRDFRTYDAAQRAAAIQTQTVRSLDSSLIFDSIDYSIDVAQEQRGPKVWAETLLAGGSALLQAGAFGGGAKKPASINRIGEA